MVTTDHGRRRGAATYRRGQAFRRRARRNVVRARTTLKTATTTEFAHTRGRLQGGRAPTRGAPTARTIWQRALVCAHERAPTRGEGTHKGCPYGPERYGNERWFVHTRGHPQGGRAPTRGAPTGPNDMATSVGLCTREGTHKGGGRPQGAPLRARTIWQRALVKLAAISWQALSDPRCGRRYLLESALYHPRRETAAPRG